ncbi:MAG TPA: hypothetical protein VFN87_02065 [Solirubrobacteraceae bacterium]|nr:hypothetical protein [Solirubrobacteraceae bacterium]
MSRPQLAALQIADAATAWAALGFTVTDDGVVALGGVELWLDAAGRGITGWTLRGLARRGDIDGLPTGETTDAPPPAPAEHRNGATGIDQVVVTTPDFERTAAALQDAGMPLRRVRDAGGFRQGFRRIGPAILELVEVPHGPAGPARFWGLVVVVPDVEALRQRLAPLVGEVRDAVQPGRHIAALTREAGLTVRVAFMDPE